MTDQLWHLGTQYVNSKTFSPDEIDYLAVYKRDDLWSPPGAQDITGPGDNLRKDIISSMIDSQTVSMPHFSTLECLFLSTRRRILGRLAWLRIQQLPTD